MGDSRRKRWQRGQTMMELQRRGLGADTCKLSRWPWWRDVPGVDHQSDYIIPDDDLEHRLMWCGMHPYPSKRIHLNELLGTWRGLLYFKNIVAPPVEAKS